ncbi:MAG: HAD family hydrolase [Alphaproteobacteria bacterium]
MSQPKAILFDWDNTLIDSWLIIHDALNFTFAAYDKPLWSLDETKLRVRKSLRDSFPGIFGDDWSQAADTFYARFDDIHLDMLSPIDGSAQMLNELSGLGIYLGVVSNKRGEYLRREARHLGWDVHFGKLVGALDAAADKPSPHPVTMALAGSGIVAGPDVWFVGDADIDMECAHNTGMTGVLLRTEAPATDEFPDHPPTHYVADGAALCKLVKEL